MDIKELYNELKLLECQDNVILPKRYLKNFLLMSMLILEDNRNINKEEIFKYLKNDSFEIPSSWGLLDSKKQEKFYENMQELIDLLK